jgi:hypothetical protein
MRFTYEVKGGMYIYKGAHDHGGIVYSLDQISLRLTRRFGAGNFVLA